jgi:hypothetical protein
VGLAGPVQLADGQQHRFRRPGVHGHQPRFPVTNGDQSFNQSVQFTALAGAKITSLVFSSTDNAFESANFSITPIPEPETYALMMAGLGVMGFVARRRRKG